MGKLYQETPIFDGKSHGFPVKIIFDGKNHGFL
jgi:hypothetical protein